MLSHLREVAGLDWQGKVDRTWTTREVERSHQFEVESLPAAVTSEISEHGYDLQLRWLVQVSQVWGRRYIPLRIKPKRAICPKGAMDKRRKTSEKRPQGGPWGLQGVRQGEEREGGGLPKRREQGNLTRGCGSAAFPNEARVRGNPGLAGKFLGISVHKAVAASVQWQTTFWFLEWQYWCQWCILKRKIC